MYESWDKMPVMFDAGLDISPVITHRCACSDFEQGFAAMISGNTGKVVLDWTSLGSTPFHQSRTFSFVVIAASHIPTSQQ